MKTIYVMNPNGKIEIWHGRKRKMLKDHLNRTGYKLTWDDYLRSCGNYCVVDGRKHRKLKK